MGQIELAAGGVLFLGEVSELTPAAQAKFLRVLQEREFRRLGGTRAVQANARVIAATNRDLHQAVAQGQFRLDLYDRLNVFEIRIPPLRERREDILSLAHAFLQKMERSTVAEARTQTRHGLRWTSAPFRRELFGNLVNAPVVEAT